MRPVLLPLSYEATKLQLLNTEIWCSTVYVVPEETAFATYKRGLKSGTVVQVMVAVKLQSTGSSEDCTHDPWFTRPVLLPLSYEATRLQLLATKIWCSTVYVVPEETAFATYKQGLKSGTVVQVMVAIKLQCRPQAPVRIELTTTRLRSECLCRGAMKPQSSSFWLRKSGVPLFMWCQRRQRLPPTSLERGLKSGTVVQVMVAVQLQCRAQAPVRIELTTPGLLDQCSN